MKAMVLERPRTPLVLRELTRPEPGPGKVLLQVEACGVCRTDLHVIDGDLTEPKLPLILGHEIVGRVRALGKGADGIRIGGRYGVPWLGYTCGACRFCRSGRENLCDNAAFTGYQIDGGYAEYTVADPRYCFPVPDSYDPAEAAPLLCAGLIGYRSYRMVGDGKRIGLYGFGAAAHIIAQVAIHHGREIYALTKPGDVEGQEFARSLGAVWAAGSDERPPEELDAAIIFAPVGPLVPIALRAVGKGGVVVCAGIHMSPIPEFPYEWLWGERTIRSVANLTRRDGEAFFPAAAEAGVRTSIERFPLSEANAALDRLREGRIKGAAVLEP